MVQFRLRLKVTVDSQGPQTDKETMTTSHEHSKLDLSSILWSHFPREHSSSPGVQSWDWSLDSHCFPSPCERTGNPESMAREEQLISNSVFILMESGDLVDSLIVTRNFPSRWASHDSTISLIVEEEHGEAIYPCLSPVGKEGNVLRPQSTAPLQMGFLSWLKKFYTQMQQKLRFLWCKSCLHNEHVPELWCHIWWRGIRHLVDKNNCHKITA